MQMASNQCAVSNRQSIPKQALQKPNTPIEISLNENRIMEWYKWDFIKYIGTKGSLEIDGMVPDEIIYCKTKEQSFLCHSHVTTKAWTRAITVVESLRQPTAPDHVFSALLKSGKREAMNANMWEPCQEASITRCLYHSLPPWMWVRQRQSQAEHIKNTLTLCPHMATFSVRDYNEWWSVTEPLSSLRTN